jgi:hypothetical protein
MQVVMAHLADPYGPYQRNPPQHAIKSIVLRPASPLGGAEVMEAWKFA